MTHTLHRTGNMLENDYIILAMPVKGVNKEGSKQKLIDILDIGIKNGAVNAGDTQSGNIYSVGLDGLKERMKDGAVLNLTFDKKENVIKTLKEIKDLQNGMSVVVTGLMEHTGQCCEEAGLKRHTVARSLGVWGKTEKLPEERFMNIMTMCGHGLITAALIYDLAEKVRSGKMTLEQAGIEVAKPCVCGACNPVKAALLIKEFL